MSTVNSITCIVKGVGSLTAEIGPVLSRKLKVRFTLFFCGVHLKNNVFVFTLILSFVVLPPCVTLAYTYICQTIYDTRSYLC